MLHAFGKHAACESFLRLGVAPEAKTIIDGSLHGTHRMVAPRPCSNRAGCLGSTVSVKHQKECWLLLELPAVCVQPRVNLPVRRLHQKMVGIILYMKQASPTGSSPIYAN